MDPRTNFSVEWGTDEDPEVRGYHNVALLLPDGRVLSGSGNHNYTRGDLTDYRIYSPSYMFQPRPEIQHVPPTLDYGNYSWVTCGDRAHRLGGPHPLVRRESAFHPAAHLCQRHHRRVQLLAVWHPTDARVAPPGYYMMFLLDANHVPSVARIIKVQ